MKAALVAALVKLLAQYAPKGIKWLIDGFTKRTGDYLNAHEDAAAKLEQLGAAARGDAAAIAAVGETPEEGFRKYLTALFAKIGDSITRPVVRAAFNLVAGFVVDKLADQLFGLTFAGPGSTFAPPPLATNDVSAWQHSVLQAAAAAGKFDAPPAPAVPATPADVPTVNDPDAVPPDDVPPADDTAPPTSPPAPAAPTL